jgi:ABC-type multidrug transport system fused ATPase/permease subunit
LKDIFREGLTLPGCVFGECALPTDNPGSLIASSTVTQLQPGEIAGITIAGAAAFLALLGLLWAAVYQHHARKKDRPPEKKGATVTFDDISYTLSDGKQILNNLTGVAHAGKVLAIMGPSGLFCQYWG